MWEPLRPHALFGSRPTRDTPGAHVSGNFEEILDPELHPNAAPLVNRLFGLRGLTAGAGLAEHDASANVHVGGWPGPDGATGYGIGADAQLIRERVGQGPVSAEIGVLGGRAGFHASESTFGLGARANMCDFAATLGNDEHSLRLGGAVGAGAAGRLHYGDADADGVRELGLGFDAGPFSMDVKSEGLGHVWNGLKAGGSYISELFGGLF